MRHFDFAPLYRSTIGFDRFAQLLDSVGGVESDTTYPPYNIERLGDNQYRITMAVAGFSEPEIKIEVKESALLVKGEKKPESQERHFLHRGGSEYLCLAPNGRRHPQSGHSQSARLRLMPR